MSMNIWERLPLSPDGPLWLIIIFTLIAIFAVLVVMLVWTILQSKRENNAMSSLLKGAQMGLEKSSQTSETDNALTQIGLALGSQANQAIEAVHQHSIVRAGINKVRQNTDGIKDVQAATRDAIDEFNGVAKESDQIGRGSDYSQTEVSSISFDGLDVTKDVTHHSQYAGAGNADQTQEEVQEVPSSSFEQETLDNQTQSAAGVLQTESDSSCVQENSSSTSQSEETTEQWVKNAVMNYKCVKSQIRTYSLEDDWTFHKIPWKLFMEIYAVFNQKRASVDKTEEVEKIYNFLCEVKKQRES